MAKRNGRKFDFVLDETRLEEICVRAYNAATAKEGIFSEGIRHFLPQWNLPCDLENIPQTDKPKEESVAARYLWTVAFFERMNQSNIITRNAHRVWARQSDRWIFEPLEVAETEDISKIERILREGFQFNLQSIGESSPAERFLHNAQLLVRDYDGDPRNLIQYNTVAQARKNLMEFKGIGTGIANLFIIYLLDRQLASPRDPENALLKVDVHKGRLPINCGAVTPTNGEIYRDDSYVKTLERAYWKICRKNNFDPHVLDAVLWVIGSEVCARNDYTNCGMNCSLFSICGGNTPEDKKTGRYVVNVNGERVDSRRNRGQGVLGFS